MSYALSVCGLSPLAPGTLIQASLTARLHRFIPAGAGNTRGMVICWFITPVYPRWRGEHLLTHAAVKLVIGLSPLARGTQAGIKH